MTTQTLTTHKPKARPKAHHHRPLPQVCTGEMLGAVLIGNAEDRVNPFDTGWIVTFVGAYDDGGTKAFAWKVYPEHKRMEEAIHLIRLRARDCGMVRVGIVSVDDGNKNREL